LTIAWFLPFGQQLQRAKHGQSPIDVSERRGIGGGQPAATIGAAGPSLSPMMVH
jgi:hypothetical protein